MTREVVGVIKNKVVKKAAKAVAGISVLTLKSLSQPLIGFRSGGGKPTKKLSMQSFEFMPMC